MSLFDRFRWLADGSTLRQAWSGAPPAPNDAGVWGIGNGRVFAHTGMSGPAGSLQGIVGPHYQTEGDHAVEGAFGACWIEVERDSVPLPVLSGRCTRVRNTAVVVTELSFGGGELRIVDFAPPDRPVLIRSVACTGSFGAGDRIRVRFPAGAPAPDGSRLAREYRPGQFALVAVTVGEGADTDAGLPDGARSGGRVGAGGADSGVGRVVAEPGSLVVPAAACLERGLSVLIATGTDADDAGRVLRATGSVAARLEETRRFWVDWLTGLNAVDTWSLRWDHPRATNEAFDDLVEASKISLKLQQSLPGGGAGPMVHFKGTWARDDNGIVRGLLASGALDEARAAISYYVRASAWLGEIPNRAPLDAPASVTLPTDWSRMPVPPTEVPSWLVLQHFWWLGAGGDEDLVREHWPFLVRCLEGQAFGDGHLLPFHGDETYLHGALLSVYPERAGWPHGLIAHTPDYPTRSLEATAAWVTAAEAMAAMAGRLGRASEADLFRTRAEVAREGLESAFWQEHRGWYAPALYPVTGAPHRAPFAPVNAALLWMGYGSARPDRLRRDLGATLRHVGFGRAAPGCPYDVGGTRGMLLWDLLAIGSELAPLALAHLAGSASPSGDWAEIHGPSGGPDAGYDLAHPNRLRPWETGIALEAMLRYFRERDPADEPDLGEARAGDRVSDRTAPDDPPSPNRAESRYRRAAGRSPLTHRPSAGPAGPTHRRIPTEPGTTFRGPLARPGRTVRVTCDMRDRERGADVTLVEPAALESPLEIANLLFDPGSGARRVDRLEFGPAALSPGRATLRPRAFWQEDGWGAQLERFLVAGGVVVGWEGELPQGPRAGPS